MAETLKELIWKAWLERLSTNEKLDQTLVELLRTAAKDAKVVSREELRNLLSQKK